jgi:hypothetical protein
MPDLGLKKQAEQGARDRRGWFSKRRSGNPAGRRRGCGDPVTHAAGIVARQRRSGTAVILPCFLGSVSIASPPVKPAGRNDPVGRSQKGVMLTIVFQA